MKKSTAILPAVLLALSIAACGSNASTITPSSENNLASESTSEPAASAAGSVYYLNFKPEADTAWQELARTYTAKTGVPVKVVTAASGTYADTLTAEMAKSEAPTLFQCGNVQSLQDWNDYCLDLTGTAFVNELTTNDFNLYDDTGALKCVGYCYEAYGIIVNKALLEQAGYRVDEIRDFASLKAIAEDIHANADKLGFDAFTAPGLAGTSSWRFSGHLANMPLYYEFRDNAITTQPAAITGAYLDNYRNIWDLYIRNCAANPATLSSSTGDEAAAEFMEQRAVFYQNGSWEFPNLIESGLQAEDLTMIPIYCGVEGEEMAGLCCGTENYWAVNARSSVNNIQATLDFLTWVVTSDEGTAMMAREFGPIPFKNAKVPENVFFAAANDYTTAGNYVVTWAFNHTPNVESWRATLVSALAAYSADPTDANWDRVREAFVDGWAYEYTMQNG